MPTTAAEPGGGAEAQAPVIETARLRLRPVCGDDLDAILDLAGDPGVALQTASLPFPLTREAAATWLGRHLDGIARGRGVTFAILEAGEILEVGAILETGAILEAGGPLVGVAGCHRRAATAFGDCGYWIGRPYWGRGYMTEALGAVVRHGFEALRLERIEATVFPDNPASRRVLEKAGFTGSGRAIRPARARGGDREVDCFALDRPAWRAVRRAAAEGGVAA